MKLSRVLRWAFIITFIGGLALLFASRIFFFAAMPNWSKIIIAFFVTALFSAISLTCALTIEKGRCSRVLWSGIVASVIAASGWIIGIWFESLISDSDKTIGTNILIPVTSWSVLCALIAVLLRNRIANRAAIVTCTITIASSVLLAVFLSILVHNEMSHKSDSDLIVKLLLCALAIASCGLFLTMILVNLKQIQGETEQQAIKMEMGVICPRCNYKQTIITGGASCCRCGLGISVLVP